MQSTDISHCYMCDPEDIDLLRYSYCHRQQEMEMGLRMVKGSQKVMELVKRSTANTWLYYTVHLLPDKQSGRICWYYRCDCLDMVWLRYMLRHILRFQEKGLDLWMEEVSFRYLQTVLVTGLSECYNHYLVLQLKNQLRL